MILCLNSSGTISHILGPRYEIASVLLWLFQLLMLEHFYGVYLYMKWVIFPEPYTRNKNKINVHLDLSNYVTKLNLKNATGIDAII